MTGEPRQESRANRWEIFLSALLSLLLTGGVSYAALRFGGDSYGYGLFLGVPFLMGFFSSIVLERIEPRVWASHWMAMWSSIGLCCVAMLLTAFEGAVCIVMALPIVVPGAALGMWSARTITGWRFRNQIKCSVLTLVPLALVVEGSMNREPPMRSVTTQIVVEAPPSKIWPFLSKLRVDAPQDLLFNAGVAHPQEVRTKGLERQCVLSTGIMSERIVAFEPNRRLAFEVLSTPPCMKEWNPFGEVRAAHLTGYYESVRGEFRLIPLRANRTLIEGQSWYRHRYSPSPYWSIWTDHIVSRVHRLVLESIKRRVQVPHR